MRRCLFRRRRAHGLTIDDFEAGPFTLVDVAPGGNEISDLSGLPTANVITGARRTSTFLSDGNSLTASVPSTAGDDALTVTLGVGSRGVVELFYFSETPLDLYQGGDAIIVSVVSATPTASPGSSILGVVLADATADASASYRDFTGAGDYVFLFTEFPTVNFFDVRRIDLTIESRDQPASAARSYTISAVSVGLAEVPEPEIGAFAVAGLAAAAWRRSLRGPRH